MKKRKSGARGFLGTPGGGSSGASAKADSAKKEDRRAAPPKLQKSDELELDNDGKAHADDMLSKLESSVTQFMESKWSQCPRGS